MDEEWIAADYVSTFSRLERYRRRLRIPAEVIEAAAAAAPPVASPPRAAHAKPHPRKFIVADDGTVTLIDWGWATLAPPEWDYSLAVWETALDVGVDASDALSTGYGRVMSDESLQPWIIYHSGMLLVNQAESRDGPMDDLAPIVSQLAAMV
jgi:aminoglycoside phosphotransferase (APT) family kinase protein